MYEFWSFYVYLLVIVFIVCVMYGVYNVTVLILSPDESRRGVLK